MSGVAIDTLNQITKYLNITFQNIPTSSWSQSQEFLKEKKCDILPAAVSTKERLKYFNFTKPYLELPLAIFTEKNKPLVNNLSEIIHKPWSRHEGSSLIQLINKQYPNNKLIKTKSTIHSLQSVNNGVAYFTIATLPVASNLIIKYQLDNLQIAGYSNILYKISIAVRNDDLLLRDILDNALAHIPELKHNEILKSWIKNK